MRRIAKNSGWTTGLVLATLLSLLVAVPGHIHATTPAGITINPATATLSLAKGKAQQQATFSVTNNYDTPVALHFAFAQAVQTPGAGASATQQLSISPADITLAGGASVSPVMTLTDSNTLSPGSQQVELIITQQATPGNTVSVVPSICMPLIVVKEDGAVTSFAVSNSHASGFSFSLPNAVTLQLKNTGNMIAIPRGFITIEDARGRQIGKGVLNTASVAVAPGGQTHLSTPITMLAHAWLPGMYHIQVSYGVGGGQQPATLATRLFYLPVWQILLLVLLGAVAFCGWQIWVEYRALRQATRQKSPAPAGHGRSSAAGKDAP